MIFTLNRSLSGFAAIASHAVLALPVAFAMLAASASHATTQVAPGVIRHETPDQPPAFVDPRQVRTSPPALVQRGEFVSVQVNVDADGNNILGDAANEPSIAVDPNRPYLMAVGWRQFDSIASNFRQAGRAYTRDNGRTWTFPGVLTPGVFRSDPVLRADDQGRTYYSTLRGNFAVEMFVSLDNGITYGPPVPAFGGDKQWFTVDNTASIGHGHLYQSWSIFAGCCGNNTFIRSADHAASWTTPIEIPNNPIFGTLDVDRDGILYIAGVSPFDFSIFVVARSSNARNASVAPTFELSTFVDLGGSMVFQATPNPAGLLGQANLYVDRSGAATDGNVYLLCSVDPPGPDPMDLHIVRSTDGGATWSAPVRINDDAAGNWQWFGTLGVAPNGRLDAVWNDTRASGSAIVSETYYAFSNDAGQTWSANVPLTPPWNSTLGWPQQNKIGDYYDMHSDAVGADLIYAATFNGEQDVYYLRIGSYDCNNNAVADETDVSSGHSPDCNANGVPDECDLPGDFDADGAVDPGDVAGFVAALLDAAGACSELADLNGDAAADGDDVRPFVAALW